MFGSVWSVMITHEETKPVAPKKPSPLCASNGNSHRGRSGRVRSGAHTHAFRRGDARHIRAYPWTRNVARSQTLSAPEPARPHRSDTKLPSLSAHNTHPVCIGRLSVDLNAIPTVDQDQPLLVTTPSLLFPRA